MKIIIPYRDRAQHLPAWENIPDVLFVEQADDQPFNRGKLLNIGFLESPEETLFVFNDVDLIPAGPYPRNFPGSVCQLATSTIQTANYLGGSTMISRPVFQTSGGYHNDYFSRGEDNEYFFHLQRMHIPIRQLSMSFTEQPHERTGPEFILDLWRKAQAPRKVQNQLSICEYKVIERKEGWIKVEL